MNTNIKYLGIIPEIVENRWKVEAEKSGHGVSFTEFAQNLDIKFRQIYLPDFDNLSTKIEKATTDGNYLEVYSIQNELCLLIYDFHSKSINLFEVVGIIDRQLELNSMGDLKEIFINILLDNITGEKSPTYTIDVPISPIVDVNQFAISQIYQNVSVANFVGNQSVAVARSGNNMENERSKSRNEIFEEFIEKTRGKFTSEDLSKHWEIDVILQFITEYEIITCKRDGVIYYYTLERYLSDLMDSNDELTIPEIKAELKKVGFTTSDKRIKEVVGKLLSKKS
jgi:hypothetical protein